MFEKVSICRNEKFYLIRTTLIHEFYYPRTKNIKDILKKEAILYSANLCSVLYASILVEVSLFNQSPSSGSYFYILEEVRFFKQLVYPNTGSFMIWFINCTRADSDYCLVLSSWLCIYCLVDVLMDTHQYVMLIPVQAVLKLCLSFVYNVRY